MLKNLKKVLITVVALLLLAAVFVGCTSYKWGPITGDSADAVTQSNGGMVVKHGDYYYFLNGRQTYENITAVEDNKFGSVEKNSIARAKMGSDGKLTDIQIVVPKVAMNKNTKQGFSIFGNYIYYVSPSVATDNKGAVQTSYTEYYRCKLDGSGTQMLIRLEGDSAEYKFTEQGLIYPSETSLMFLPYSDKKVGSAKEIATDVTSSLYATDSTAVFFTKATTSKTSANNILSVVMPDGSVKEIINEDDKTNESEKFARTLKFIVQEGDSTVLYYEKSNVVNGASNKLGLFGYKFDATFAYDGAKEKQFTNIDSLTLLPISFEIGVLVTDSAATQMYIPNIVVENGVAVDKIENRIVFKLTSTTPTIFKILKEGEKTFMYYTASNAMYKVEMNMTNGGFVGNAITVIKESLVTDWYGIEIIGNNIFYINSKYLNYMYYADITSIDITSEDGATINMLAQMTEKDKEAYDKLIEDENKDKK